MAVSSAPRDIHPRAASCRVASDAAATRRCSQSSQDSKLLPREGPCRPARPHPAPAVDGIGPRAPRHDLDVNDNVRREVKDQGITIQRPVVAQPSADLGKAPAKRTKRVVGFGEEPRSELLPGRRTFTQDQIGQGRPALPASELVGVPVRALQMGTTQQVNGQGHRFNSAERLRSALWDRGSPRSTGRRSTAEPARPNR